MLLTFSLLHFDYLQSSSAIYLSTDDDNDCKLVKRRNENVAVNT